MGTRQLYLFLADLEGSAAAGAKMTGVNRALRGALDSLNDRHRAHLPWELSINYGDEVAGLFDSPEPLFDIVRTLQDTLRGLIGFRYVVAFGAIGAETSSLTEVGGPVFKDANDAIKALKRRRRRNQWLFSDERLSQTLTVLGEHQFHLFESLTDYQYDVLLGTERGETQAQIAERLGKYPQSVSDAVRRGGIELLIETEDLLRGLLGDLAAQGETP